MGEIMKNKFNVQIREYAIFVFFILLFVVLSVTAKGFLSTENLINVARQVSLIGIVSVGMTIIILTGGIDLSVGSVLAASSTICAYFMVNMHLDMVTSCIIAIVIGGLIGLFNGILITYGDIPPLITTLATMTGARGLAYIATQGIPIYGFPKAFAFLGQGYIWKIPFPVILMVITFILGYILLNKLAFGRHIYGIGGNEEAVLLSGINIKKIKMIVYVLSGTLAGFAGIVLLSRINTGIPTAGSGFEMDVITAVVLGGVSIAGGEGKLRGVFIGVLIMGILSNGLIILNVQEYYQWVVRCFVLLLAVGFDRNAHRLKSRKKIVIVSD